MSDVVAPVSVDQPADQVTRITLNRPEQRNAATVEMITALHAALDEIQADHHTRVVILTGAGDNFSVGLDGDGFGITPETQQQGQVQRNQGRQRLMAGIVPKMRSLRQPVIAAVNGPASATGFAYACAADIRYCSTNAEFSAGFPKLAMSGCDMGLSWTLPRMIGTARSWELLLTGRRIDAIEAERLGIVTSVVNDDLLLPTVLGVAEEIIMNSPLGVWMTKDTLWATSEVSSLDAAMAIENRTQVMAAETTDSRAAFRRTSVEFGWRNR